MCAVEVKEQSRKTKFLGSQPRSGRLSSFNRFVLYSYPVSRCCQREGPEINSSALPRKLFDRARCSISGGSSRCPLKSHSPGTPVLRLECRALTRSKID